MALTFRTAVLSLLLLICSSSALHINLLGATPTTLVKRGDFFLSPRTQCSNGGTTCQQCFGSSWISCPSGSQYTCWDPTNTQDTEYGQCNDVAPSSTPVPTNAALCMTGGTTCAQCFGPTFQSCPSNSEFGCWDPTNSTAGPESEQCYGIYPSSTILLPTATPPPVPTNTSSNTTTPIPPSSPSGLSAGAKAGIGGGVGGAGALILIGGLIWFMRRKKRNTGDTHPEQADVKPAPQPGDGAPQKEMEFKPSHPTPPQPTPPPLYAGVSPGFPQEQKNPSTTTWPPQEHSYAGFAAGNAQPHHVEPAHADPRPGVYAQELDATHLSDGGQSMRSASPLSPMSTGSPFGSPSPMQGAAELHSQSTSPQPVELHSDTAQRPVELWAGERSGPVELA